MNDNTYSYHLNNFTLNHSCRNNPTDITTHIHEGYELFYFISGDLTYYIEGQVYQLEPQDMIITNRRELHRIVFQSKELYERKFIHFKPEFVSFLQSEELNLFYYLEKRKLGYYNKINSKEVISSGIADLWDKIEAAAKEDSQESPLLIKLHLTQLLIEINRIYSKKKEIIVPAFDSNDKIIDILEFINTHLEQKLTLDLLEQLFYVNKYYLCHIFKLNTGFTVNEYITYKRIMKAQELLNKKIPVLEVSDAVGFGDYSNFYKSFKKIVGCSPKNYVK